MNKKMNYENNNYPWINPVGGLGDTLMVSGVLKLLHNKNPENKFNLVRRKKYSDILRGHPAIELIGFPPADAEILGTDYWAKEKLGSGKQRAFQILARMYHLETPVEEKLFYPGKFDTSDLLLDIIPWKRKNVLLAPSSESPRKEMPPRIWQQVIDRLINYDILVIHAGKQGEIHLPNTYSISGITTPCELINLLGRIDLVLCADNFVMHAAHLRNKPAIVTWGPTNHKVYGYSGHIHLQAPLDHCEMKDKCLGPKYFENYSTPCPLNENHCLSKITADRIFNIAMEILN